ncbi:hypothetical protein GSU68_12845 [Rathayibacter sp. VKM Ac-2759]|uniref:hypothetical protein n=1 Tax=Rathayibacter sp. VKM Ac-2759 TaxID=2609252 RepID=UPI001318B763|nr:hypothetical protein [Rathayibacter sp. VKM Ac-2759]QHC67364.1 hypothetical protein GSU68_12845 [Rathayibacter sp. VKM Ac-2759]
MSAQSGLSLSRFTRTTLGVIATLLSAVSSVVMYREGSPEVGGVAFVAVAGALFVLAAVGRVPSKIGFGASGTVEFDAQRADDLADILSRLDSADRATLSSLLSATRDETVQSALTQANEEANFEERVLAEVEQVRGVSVDRDVSVPTGGRGRPMILDAVINLNGQKLAVEVRDKWSESPAARRSIDRLARAVQLNEYRQGFLVLPSKHVERVHLLEEDIRVLDPGSLIQLLKTVDK